MTRDIHCVTSWSKLNTAWEGVAVDDILADAGLSAPTPFALAHCYDGYSTNVPLADLATGKAMVALKYEGQPLPRDHGGPARLLVPHLYFWKSAKWVNGLQFTERDEAGFWEPRGYHMYGDPWREQRYTNDRSDCRKRAMAELRDCRGRDENASYQELLSSPLRNVRLHGRTAC